MGWRRYKKRSNAAVGAKLHALKNGGNALAAANTHGDQRIATLDALQLVQGLHGDQRARGTNGVTQRNARSVGVDLGRVQPRSR
jgi:hypothetical protein